MRLATYSIVALDADTGEFGAAVQSHWLAVGAICIWTHPGVGAVATQADARPAYGPELLDQLERGESVSGALNDAVGQDRFAAGRQVGIVAADGSSAAHTGVDCIPFAGHVTGDGFSCQANMMLREGVPEAMARSFAATGGDDLVARLLAALDAAEEQGGDVRGRQSAALIVTPPTGERWQKTIDVRVDDHHQPLDELHRLVRLSRAAALADRAYEKAQAKQPEEAAALSEAATALAPELDELLFWWGVALAGIGDLDGATKAVADAIERNARWKILLDRLEPAQWPNVERLQRAVSR